MHPWRAKALTIELKPEHERIVELAVQSGAYHDPNEVIGTALSMRAEDIEDAAVSEAHRAEPRYCLGTGGGGTAGTR